MAEDPDGEDPDGESNAGRTPAASRASPSGRTERAVAVSEQVMQAVELVAAFVLVGLFAIGVFDLGLGIYREIRSGDISDPLVVIGFIDTALLLFIIVEVYNTVVAYARSDETARILRLVIFTGVIALVRKAIVYRTGEYETTTDALLVAVSYGTLTVALALLLYVSYQYVGGRPDDPAEF